jgi:RHS repeat-associated protein
MRVNKLLSGGTDKLFTGQRLDDTGLYYYGARYYEPTIGRFLSPDSISPNFMNPQSFNRYSYVFNNPLKYNDPSGSWPNWADVRETAGKVINAGKGALQVAISKTVEIYQAARQLPGQAQQAAMHAVGIEYVTTYTDTKLMADPVPVYHVGDEGIVPTLLGDRLGISLYPVGTFVKESALSENPSLPAHESFHYSEQADWGALWYAGYAAEVVARDIYYWDPFWGYYTSSFEQRARDYANQESLAAPDPWWQEPVQNFTQTVESYVETVADYYYDYYYYDYYWYYYGMY